MVGISNAFFAENIFDCSMKIPSYWTLAKGLVDGVVAGCFPQLYTALGSNPPDQVITL